MNEQPTTPVQPEQTIDDHQTLTPAEVAIVQGWAKDLPPDQAAKIHDELGTPMEQRTDTGTEGAKELDDAGFVPAKPEDFDAVRFHLPNDEPTPEHRHAATLTRTWLSEAGFPRELGNALFKTGNEVALQIQGMTDHKREAWGQAEYAKLEKVYGADLERKLEMAGRMVNRIEERQPGLKALLRKGLGDSARFASLLIQQSERYWGRRSG